MKPRSIFLEDLKPVAQIEQNIQLIPLNKFYTVEWIEPIPQIVKDFGAVSALSKLEKKEVKEVHLRDNCLAQYRGLPLDYIKIDVYRPTALKQYALKNVESYIVRDVAAYSPKQNLLEFFQWEDEDIFFDITNPTQYDINMSRVLFYGFQYKLKGLIERPTVYTVVPIQAMPR